MTHSLIMSMSGTRGVVGGSMTPAVALETGLALGTYLTGGTVVVGGDTRTSHDTYKSAVISGLLATGCTVIDIGRVTTPTVQQMIGRFNAAAGIVVTASHNPSIWNGLKVMNGLGSFMSPAEYTQFEAVFRSKNWQLKDWQSQGELIVDPSAIQAHVDLVLSKIRWDHIQKSGLRVLVDANHGAGAVADPVLLQALGVDATILNAEPNGRFAHDPEPLEKNLDHIKSVMAGGGYDIGFVQDADADRLVILDETGRFIGEDYSLAFCVDHILSLEQADSPTVVVNLSTSQVIADVASRYNATVVYTKIGESHVTQGIKSAKAVVGGEGNGGVIYPKVGWGRDSLVGMVVALSHLATTKQTVSQIVAGYPRYTMLRDKVSVMSQADIQSAIEAIESRFPGFPVNREDGVKITLPNGWVHVRPSNTEPIVRLFVEADSPENAADIMSKARQS